MRLEREGVKKRLLNPLRKSEGHLKSRAGDLRRELRRMENVFLRPRAVAP